MGCSSWPSRRTSTRRALLVLLTVGLLSGCAQAGPLSGYRVTIPELDCEPLYHEYRGLQLVTLCRNDYRRIVRELKAACLAEGQTPKECQAE